MKHVARLSKLRPDSVKTLRRGHLLLGGLLLVLDFSDGAPAEVHRVRRKHRVCVRAHLHVRMGPRGLREVVWRPISITYVRWVATRVAGAVIATPWGQAAPTLLFPPARRPASAAAVRRRARPVPGDGTERAVRLARLDRLGRGGKASPAREARERRMYEVEHILFGFFFRKHPMGIRLL